MAVIFLGNYVAGNGTSVVLRFHKTVGTWEVGNQDLFGSLGDFVVHRDGGLPDVGYDPGGIGISFSVFASQVAIPQDVLEVAIGVTPSIVLGNTGTVVFPAGMFGDLGPTNLTPASTSNGAADVLDSNAQGGEGEGGEPPSRFARLDSVAPSLVGVLLVSPPQVT